MNKRLNTFIFVIVASLANIILTMILAILGIWGISRLGIQDPSINRMLFLGVFVLAIVIVFFAYRFVVGLIMKKVDLESHFAPMWGRKRR